MPPIVPEPTDRDLSLNLEKLWEIQDLILSCPDLLCQVFPALIRLAAAPKYPAPSESNRITSPPLFPTDVPPIDPPDFNLFPQLDGLVCDACGGVDFGTVKVAMHTAAVCTSCGVRHSIGWLKKRK